MLPECRYCMPPKNYDDIRHPIRHPVRATLFGRIARVASLGQITRHSSGPICSGYFAQANYPAPTRTYLLGLLRSDKLPGIRSGIFARATSLGQITRHPLGHICSGYFAQANRLAHTQTYLLGLLRSDKLPGTRSEIFARGHLAQANRLAHTQTYLLGQIIRRPGRLQR